MRVCPGRYAEQLTITRSVHLQGEIGAVASLDCLDPTPKRSRRRRRHAVRDPRARPGHRGGPRDARAHRGRRRRARRARHPGRGRRHAAAADPDARRCTTRPSPCSDALLGHTRAPQPAPCSSTPSGSSSAVRGAASGSTTTASATTRLPWRTSATTSPMAQPDRRHPRSGRRSSPSRSGGPTPAPPTCRSTTISPSKTCRTGLLGRVRGAAPDRGQRGAGVTHRRGGPAAQLRRGRVGQRDPRRRRGLAVTRNTDAEVSDNRVTTSGAGRRPRWREHGRRPWPATTSRARPLAARPGSRSFRRHQPRSTTASPSRTTRCGAERHARVRCRREPRCGAPGSQLRRNVVSGNRGDGIVLGPDIDGLLVSGNVANDNGVDGIRLEAGASDNVLEDNVALGNGASTPVTCPRGPVPRRCSTLARGRPA